MNILVIGIIFIQIYRRIFNMCTLIKVVICELIFDIIVKHLIEKIKNKLFKKGK